MKHIPTNRIEMMFFDSLSKLYVTLSIERSSDASKKKNIIRGGLI